MSSRNLVDSVRRARYAATAGWTLGAGATVADDAVAGRSDRVSDGRPSCQVSVVSRGLYSSSLYWTSSRLMRIRRTLLGY